eukprot:TRINITY_DN10863_c0_g3_i1.p1 TRINITY_DN10863_c0_g3~~TRINITY_DN10863_c0_g3_i1.p1  ORF type:complete len:625 (+),score=152.64 TRINITY_DN10863_c0_g3_i1:122-1996(+)
MLRATALVAVSATLFASSEVDINDPVALELDDQCVNSDSEGCALNALQRQAKATSELHMAAEPVKAYGQCAGKGIKGTLECEEGYTCWRDNKWWSMCKPAAQAAADTAKKAQLKSSNDDDDDDDDDQQDQPAPQRRPVSTKPAPHLPHRPPMGHVHAVGPVNPIVIRGNFLYDAVTGKRFFSKGVAYNPRNIIYDEVEKPNSKTCKGASGTPEFKTLGYAADPVTDELEEQWGPALKAIANLGANTVRLYNIDPEKKHGKFMEAAAKLGIYVIVPLTRKDWGYLPAFPSPDCYTRVIDEYGNVGVNVLTTAKLIVKEFSNFPNTLMFTVANEMSVNDKNGFAAFPCVKALTRDVHRYQKSCAESMRRIPLIYSDMDMGPPDRVKIGEYLTCALEDEDDAVDAYGLNVYSWCDKEYPDADGVDSFKYSPYYEIYKDFKHFSKPLIFSEFGCNTGAFGTDCPYKGGRTWPDVKHIFNEMGQVLSGAVAFEFSMEKNEYGMVLTPGFLKGQNDYYFLDNYYALQKEFKKYDVSGTWDGIDVEKCSALPSDVARLSVSKHEAKCPPQSVAKHIMVKHRVDNVSDWYTIPPTPEAPLVNVHNQTECPTGFEPSAVDKREQCCHFKADFC